MVRTYDPKTVKVLVSGFPVGGFADDTFVTVKRSNDTFEKVVGVGGIVSRAKSLDRSGEIRILLHQTSMSNDVLSALMLADELTNSGIFPVAILDLASKSVFVSAFAWIRKPVDVEYGKSLTQREWTLEAADIDILVGGNVGSD